MYRCIPCDCHADTAPLMRTVVQMIHMRSGKPRMVLTTRIFPPLTFSNNLLQACNMRTTGCVLTIRYVRSHVRSHVPSAMVKIPTSKKFHHPCPQLCPPRVMKAKRQRQRLMPYETACISSPRLVPHTPRILARRASLLILRFGSRTQGCESRNLDSAFTRVVSTVAPSRNHFAEAIRGLWLQHR